MAADKNIALRKRQQIENAGRTMFMWVAIAAVVVGIAAVLSVSLFERIMFNQKIIDAKNKTASTLSDNNKIIDELKANVRVMNTNAALKETPRLDESEPVSVILDALPSNPNSSALGASLQQKLLLVGGVSVESLTVDPISGVEDAKSDSDATSGEITFKFVVSADASQVSSLKKVLTNLEASIRVIDLTSITVEQQNNRVTLTAEGMAFYQSETKVELKTKSIRPGGSK